MSEWKGYILEDYKLSFKAGAMVLDIGCGNGRQMRDLISQGCSVIGLDLDLNALTHCQSLRLQVLQARAERIPILSASLEGAICKVVLPYTDENLVIREISRLLKPGAECYMICHGAGYYFRYLLRTPSWKRHVYGLRALINTWVWVLTNKRMPGFLGDTIYQSRRRLAKYYHEGGLEVMEDTPSKTFFGLPVFIQQKIRKVDTGA